MCYLFCFGFFPQQSGKVIQSTDQLAYIAHFIIIPAHSSYQLGITHILYPCLGSIKIRAEAATDDIAAHDLVFCIAKAFVTGGFHGSVHFFDSYFLLRMQVTSVSEPVIVGTRCAEPSSLPFRLGSTRPIALAAPVLLGTMFSAAARARRRSPLAWGASCVF